MALPCCTSCSISISFWQQSLVGSRTRFVCFDVLPVVLDAQPWLIGNGNSALVIAIVFSFDRFRVGSYVSYLINRLVDSDPRILPDHSYLT